MVAKKRTWKTTLAEIGLVILILFGLAALLIPQFVRCCGCRGTLTACKSNLKNIGTAMEMYSTDFNGHYPRNINLLTPNYLKTIPECPAARRVTYRADFGPNAPGNEEHHFVDYYIIECTGDTHRDYGVMPNYPMYNGIEGLLEGREIPRQSAAH